MKELIERALDEANSLGLTAEVRLTDYTEETVNAKNAAPDACGTERSISLGITVFHNGYIGFASTSSPDADSVALAVRRAYAIAKGQEHFRKLILLIPELNTDVHAEPLISPYDINPFSVPIEEKLALLEQATRPDGKGVYIITGYINSYRRDIWYANTAGAFFRQILTSCGACVKVYAIEDGEVQVRSYPSQDSSFAQRGYEYINSMNLVEGAQRAQEEARELLKADECPAGNFTVVISPDQMALQIHESVGHPTEFDRVLGYEISLAGASYLKPEDAGRRKVASEQVSIVADATYPGGNGSFFYDDEGTPAQKFFVIENGVLKNFLMSRESAAAAGLTSNGCARADSALRYPIVRMTNINLMPGDGGSLEDLISDIKQGIYLETTKSWSIDDLRLNFQFAVEWAREIKNGKLGKVYRNASYTGITPKFWSGVMAIGSQESFRMFGYTNCGKGDPMQAMHVGHGSPPVVIDNVEVRPVR